MQVSLIKKCGPPKLHKAKSLAFSEVSDVRSCLYIGFSHSAFFTVFLIFCRLLRKLTKKEELYEKQKEGITLEMLQPSRYKPNDLEQMAEDTKFSKRMKNPVQNSPFCK